MNRETLDKLKQLREAGDEGNYDMCEDWLIKNDADSCLLYLADSNTPIEESASTLEYIVALHNNAEELIRMAEAGQTLAEAVKRLNDSGDCGRMLESDLATYNKTVSK